MSYYISINFMSAAKGIYISVVMMIINMVDCGVRISRDLKLLDQQGRQLMIHGTNVVVKVPPYFPPTDHFDYRMSFSTRDFQIFEELGMNGVRLGAMWAGIEPKKDWYNTTYLDEMVDLINRLGQKGIYTLVDFHQDLISEKYCGDGIPVWLIDEIHGYRTFPFPWSVRRMPLNESGVPNWKDCDQKGWGKYYVTDDVGRVFNQLYNTKSYLHRKFTQYWQQIAKRLKGNPYVIAYELINQPFAGNVVRDPLLALPSMAERFKFRKFYDSVVHSIRKIDNDTNICIQPVTFDFAFPTGFNHAPGGNLYRNKSIICYHYYSPPDRNVRKTLQRKLKDMKKLGIPMMLSQYGGTPQARQFAEDHQQAHFYWHYKQFGKGWGSRGDDFKMKQDLGILVNPDGSLNEQQIPSKCRTILRRTAGSLLHTHYIQTTGYFNAVYMATPGGTSQLFASHKHTYKGGMWMEVRPKDAVTVVRQGDVYYLKNQGDDEVMIQITIKRPQ